MVSFSILFPLSERFSLAARLQLHLTSNQLRIVDSEYPHNSEASLTVIYSMIHTSFQILSISVLSCNRKRRTNYLSFRAKFARNHAKIFLEIWTSKRNYATLDLQESTPSCKFPVTAPQTFHRSPPGSGTWRAPSRTPSPQPSR